MLTVFNAYVKFIKTINILKSFGIKEIPHEGKKSCDKSSTFSKAAMINYIFREKGDTFKTYF